jgi:chromosome segregation ATPase
LTVRSSSGFPTVLRPRRTGIPASIGLSGQPIIITVSSFAPVAGDGSEGPPSIDDLLPAGPPPTPPAAPPAAPPPAAAEPPASSPAPAPAPTTPPPAPASAPIAAEIDEIEALHDEVVRATAACDGSLPGSKARRQLRAALKHEDRALRQIGCSSYSDFAQLARAAGLGLRARDVNTPGENGSSRAEAVEAAPEVPEPVTAPPASTWVTEIPVAPVEGNEAEELRRELEETRLALRLSQDEAANSRADLADAIAVRDAAGTAAETVLAQLQQERDRADAASAEAASTSRQLSEALAEVERQRQALADAATTRSTDDAHRELLEDLEQRVAREQGARVTAEAEALLAAEQLASVRAELAALQQQSGAAAEDVDARIARVRDEARRAMDEVAHAHTAQCAELEAALAAANDLVAEARAEAERAVRSRDAAVDEVASARMQQLELESQLGGLRSELARTREEQEQAVLAATAVATEAAAERKAREEELRRAGRELDAARAEAETAAVRQAADLDQARSELETARVQVEAEQARVAEVTEELDAVRRQLEQAEAEAASIDDGQLGRLRDLAGLRAEAERELTDVEDQIERLHDKRQRLKHRIQRQRTRFATERASLERQLAWARHDAAVQLAALEDRIGVVGSDAEALRAQVAEVRTTLLPGHASS